MCSVTYRIIMLGVIKMLGEVTVTHLYNIRVQ